MANNNVLFNAVLAGVTGGGQQRWITNPNAAAYSGYSAIVLSIATSVDALIAPGSYNDGHGRLMASIASGVYSGRFPSSSGVSQIAASIVALFMAQAANILGEGGTSPVSSVFGRVANVTAQIGDYAASQVNNDSSIVGTTVKDALNTLGTGGLVTVTTIAARNALTALKEGMLVYVQSLQVYYELQPDLVTWAIFDANPKLSTQTVWYVDQGGNDNNDGKTPGTAIATLAELNSRLCPRGKPCYLTNDVTVNLNTVSLTAFTYTELQLNLATNQPLIGGLAAFTVSVVCGITSSAPITLTGAVYPNAATSTRGQLTTAVGTLVDKERIRITSGTAVGAVGYCTGLNGDAQHAFVSSLSLPTIAGLTVNSGHGSVLQPIAGDTCVVDTIITTINRVSVTCTTFARLFIQDARITGFYAKGDNRSLFAGSGGLIILSGCVQISPAGTWQNNAQGVFLLACRTLVTSKTALVGVGWCIVEHAIQGGLYIDGEVVSYGLTIDGGQLRIGNNNDPNHPGQASPSSLIAFTSQTNSNAGGAIEVENGTGGVSIFNNSAILVATFSQLLVTDFNSYLWGASASYGYAITIMANAYVLQGNVSAGVIAAIYKIPSLVNLCIANLFFTYSDNPISIPNQNCGLIAGSYNVANNYNQTDGNVYLTAQSGNKAGTAFGGLVQAGLYEVTAYIATTIVDAAATGAPTVNIIFIDDSGTTQTKAIATSPSLTALGGAGGTQIIENVAGNGIQWSITGITSAGNSKYSVRIRISQISLGA